MQNAWEERTAEFLFSHTFKKGQRKKCEPCGPGSWSHVPPALSDESVPFAR